MRLNDLARAMGIGALVYGGVYLFCDGFAWLVTPKKREPKFEPDAERLFGGVAGGSVGDARHGDDGNSGHG